MVFQLVIVITIPIILGIVVVPPFDTPEPPKEITVSDEPLTDNPERNFIYFFLILVWFFFLIRILFQMKKGTFKLQRKF